MSYDVHLHVCFEAICNDGIAELARKHLALLPEKPPHGPFEPYWYLTDLSKRTGNNPGSKGGLSLWGIVGNYVHPDEFVEDLRPFWLELLAGDIDGGPMSSGHILFFWEAEQSERANAIEICLGGDYGRDRTTLVIKDHPDLPFSWMQF